MGEQDIYRLTIRNARGVLKTVLTIVRRFCLLRHAASSICRAEIAELPILDVNRTYSFAMHYIETQNPFFHIVSIPLHGNLTYKRCQGLEAVTFRRISGSLVTGKVKHS